MSFDTEPVSADLVARIFVFVVPVVPVPVVSVAIVPVIVIELVRENERATGRQTDRRTDRRTDGEGKSHLNKRKQDKTRKSTQVGESCFAK